MRVWLQLRVEDDAAPVDPFAELDAWGENGSTIDRLAALKQRRMGRLDRLDRLDAQYQQGDKDDE